MIIFESFSAEFWYLYVFLLQANQFYFKFWPRQKKKYILSVILLIHSSFLMNKIETHVQMISESFLAME